MNAFIEKTMYDIRSGRESWRVFVAVCAPSLAVTLIALAVRQVL